MPEKTVQKEPGKKPAPSKKPKPQQEVVVQIPLSELHPFPDHPFQVREDASMQETAESVKEYGVLVPALARPREDGGYELIAGHRRKHACELAGLTTMPVIVRDIDRDAATIIMVDSNLQRENILPSERAKAYKMKMEAIKRQGARTDLTSPKISAKFRSDDEVGQEAGVSGDTIRNYIDRTFHVLAITVCQADWDRRYSPDNRAWANAMSIPANPDTWGTDRNCYLAVNSHPGLVDLFLSQTRKAYAQERQKTSVRDKLKKPPETTSPKISAKSKAPER